MEKPNLWCVAGVPGVGKSTLTTQLDISGGFETVEVDDRTVDMGHEIDILALNKLSNPSGFNSEQEYTAAVQRMAPVYRHKFEQILVIMNYPGFEFEKKSESAFRTLLLIRDDVQFMKLIVEHAQSIMDVFVRVLPHFESWQRAIEIAKLKEQTALLVSHNLTSRALRTRALTYFKSCDINPGLLIVKGIRTRLLHAASQRVAAGIDKHFFADRASLKLIDGAQDYNPEEGWGRVVVVKRESPDEGIESIRAKLLRQMETTIMSPIPFVTKD